MDKRKFCAVFHHHRRRDSNVALGKNVEWAAAVEKNDEKAQRSMMVGIIVENIDFVGQGLTGGTRNYLDLNWLKKKVSGFSFSYPQTYFHIELWGDFSARADKDIGRELAMIVFT